MPTDVLQTWLEKYMPGIPVRIVDSAQPDPVETDQGCICLALCDVGAVDRHMLPRRDGLRSFRVRMTYRLTAAFARPQDGHAVLRDIMFAALENPMASGPDNALIPIDVLATATARDRFGPQQGAGLYLEIVAERVTGERDAPPVLEAALVNARPSHPQTGPGT